MTRGRGHTAKVEDDHGAEGPLRRCIVSGEVQAPERMVRFVEGPDRLIVPDVAHKLPGRGFWVTSTREAVSRACEKGLFAKAAKAAVICPPDLPDLVEKLLVQRCIEHLGLARRAGRIVSGFAQVEAAFRARDGRIAALVEASESGPADRGKLMTYAQRQGAIPVIGCLSQAEIGLAFGRESVVHAALTAGALAIRFVTEAERLGGFRVLCPPEWGAA
ncbi:MAG: RNA-binding protein [Alphaproteobacteria bacterium]|nr:RNA-binding protein [Alphaproteobacteria bacterium]